MSSPIERARQQLAESQTISYFLALDLTAFAEEQEKRAKYLDRQLIAESNRAEVEKLDNVRLNADKASLEHANRRLWWGLIAAGFCIVGLLIALWSAYAS